MSENPTENTENTENQAEETSGAVKGPETFPSPIPALVKASDRAERPGFRSPPNKGTKAMKKAKGKGKGKKRR